jgi:hypothetical protein
MRCFPIRAAAGRLMRRRNGPIARTVGILGQGRLRANRENSEVKHQGDTDPGVCRNAGEKPAVMRVARRLNSARSRQEKREPVARSGAIGASAS